MKSLIKLVFMHAVLIEIVKTNRLKERRHLPRLHEVDEIDDY